MTATLATIDAALYAALTPLLVVGSGGITDATPFACVARFTDDMNADTLQQVGAQYPACLLRWDAEASDRDINTVSGDSEERGVAQWTVFVIVSDPRSPDDIVVGATGVPGALTLAGQVLSACNALFVTGLWRNHRVRYADSRRGLVRAASVYMIEMRFEAMRVVEQATTTQVSVTLTSIRGDLNLTGTADTPPDPFLTFDADT